LVGGISRVIVCEAPVQKRMVSSFFVPWLFRLSGWFRSTTHGYDWKPQDTAGHFE